MTEKLRRFLLSLVLAASCSGAPLAYAQTVSQDSTRAKVAGDSIVRISTSAKMDRPHLQRVKWQQFTQWHHA